MWIILTFTLPWRLHKHASILCCMYIACLVLTLLVVAVVLAVRKFSFKEVYLKNCLTAWSYRVTLWNLPIVKQIITLFYSCREIYTTQLTELFIFGVHFLWYKRKCLILVFLGCDGLQFGEFSLKRHCSHYQWHLEFQKVSFSSNIHNKLETNILTSLPAYTRQAQFILCVI